MARKLSQIARRGAWMLAAAGALAAANSGLAEDEAGISTRPVVRPNPFASRAATPQSPTAHPETPKRGPVTYHNPFAAKSAAPPMETPVRPGPVSRWRRPANAVDASPVKDAVLSTEVVPHSRIPWDQLPPPDSLLQRAAAGGFGPTSPATAPSDPPSNPIHFAAEPLAQPDWVAPQRSDSALSSIGQVAFNQPAVQDPFELPELSGPLTVAARDEKKQAEANAGNTSQIKPLSEDSQPLIISDYSESPDGFLAQAQQRAHTADSVDELSTIVGLCQRGLASGSPAELATPLRRLAAWAHNRRGELLIDEDRTAEAIKDFQVAITLDANCSLAIHNRAVTLAQQNETAAALQDFNRVIELNPGLAIAYRNRAELLASLGRYNEAVSDYNRAIDGLPDDAELYRARGSAWHRLGNFERSIEDLNRAIQLDPNDADAFTTRGNAEAERGNFGQAITDFQHAITTAPEWGEAYRSLAWLRATCPNPRYRNAEKALAAAEQAAKLSPPDDYFVLDALAAAHASAGDFDKASQLQQRALALAGTEYTEPLRQRLALYRDGQPFLSGAEPAVRAAAHESGIVE